MTVKNFGLYALRACCAAAVMMATTGGASADAVEDFYKGKTINFVIGYPAGAGYDVYARLLGTHMARHIPGQPRIVPQNMPGAGSLVAANHIYNVAPRDGTVLGAVNRTLPMAPFIEADPAKKERLRFDALKLNWIGSIEKAVSLGICKDSSGVKSFDQFREREVLQAASAPTSDSVIFPTVFNRMLGTKIKIIAGYEGTGGNILALERNEADCYLGTSYSSLAAVKPGWLDPSDPYMNVVIQIALEKHPKLPGVPLITDYASGDELAALELLLAPQVMGRPYFTSPGVPPERVAALRAAFDATMKDERFQADAGKMGAEIGPMTGAEVEALLAKIYKTDKSAVTMLQQVMPRDQ